MKSTTILLAGAVLAAMLASEARGQLFGKRSLGGSISPRMRPGTTSAAPGQNTVGTVRGNERFMRGNRRPGSFIGGDSNQRRDFVGSDKVQDIRQFLSAQAGLRAENKPDANLGQAKTAQPRTRMYDPRLRIDFEFSRPSARVLSSQLARRIQRSDSIRRTSPIEVSVEGGTATLRGAVASERDRTLARLMLLFEPGISVVRNELLIDPTSPVLAPVPKEAKPAGPADF